MMRIELEFNPFSLASRAARAERGGKVGDALELYAKGRHYRSVRACLQRTIPDGPLRALLLAAVEEIRELEERAGQAIPKGMPEAEAVMSLLANETPGAAVLIWRIAERIATAAAYRVDSPRLQAAFKHEADKLAELVDAMRAARKRLAEATLEGTDRAALESVAIGFRAIGNASRSLRSVLDETST